MLLLSTALLMSFRSSLLLILPFFRYAGCYYIRCCYIGHYYWSLFAACWLAIDGRHAAITTPVIGYVFHAMSRRLLPLITLLPLPYYNGHWHAIAGRRSAERQLCGAQQGQYAAGRRQCRQVRQCSSSAARRGAAAAAVLRCSRQVSAGGGRQVLRGAVVVRGRR